MKQERNLKDHITDKPFKKIKCIKCNTEFSVMSIDNKFKVCPICDIQKENNVG